MSPPPPASLALSSPLAPVEAPVLPTAVLPADEARLRRQGFLAVLVAAFCIGFSAIFVRLADVGPAAIGFWRLLFAIGPTALWAYAEHRAASGRRGIVPGVRRVLPFSSRQLMLATFAGFFFAADLVLFHAGLARTTTANGLLLGNLAPVFVLLLAWMCLGERPTIGLVFALLLSLAGAAVIVLESTAGAGMTAGLVGDVMCFVAAFCYAAYMLFIRFVRRPDAMGRAGLGGGMVSLLSTATGAVFCLVWALATGEQMVPATLQGFLAVAGLGIVTHALGQGLATFALGRLPAGPIAVVLLLQIVVGMSMAALMFGEVPSLTVLAGGGLIVAGILAVRPR